MGDYMNLLSHHEDPLTAAEKAFGELKQLQNGLEGYIREGNYKQFILSSTAAPIDESAFKVREVTETEADAIRADVLVGVRRDKDAQELLDGVLKADPGNAQAHETMGAIEWRAGHRDPAFKWYGEAVKLSSSNYFAYFNFASLAMSEGKGWADPEIEKSLRTALKLNPRYYPASDFLASLLAASNRDADAIAVMHQAQKSAATPMDAAKAKAKIAQLERTRASDKGRLQESGAVSANTTVVALNSRSKHPTEPTDGPTHEVEGTIHDVKCSYPSVIDFSVDGANKHVSLYSNDYYKIEFSALGFTPEDAIHPCDDIERKRARVQYAESSDKTVDGQVIAIELRK
jgi:tetratricopeptide (TPR) repeat protein